MNRLLPPALALMFVLALVAGPAAADEVPLNGPCTNVGSRTVVTPEEGATTDIDTPIGALFVGFSSEGGTYLIDLEGLPVGTTKTVDVVLSWDTAGQTDLVSDYDMVVNGTTYQDADFAQEAASITRGHCQTISVEEVYAFTGTPVDSLSLSVSINTFGF